MTSVTRSQAWLLIALASAGCSGKAITDSEIGAAGSSASNAGSSSGSASSGGSSSSGPYLGSSGSGPYGGGATGGSASNAQGGVGGGQVSAECRKLDDQDNWGVQVRIINQTTKTIYFGDEVRDCSFEPDLPFRVSDEAGSVLVPASPCRTSCQALRNGFVGGCPGSCSASVVIALKPGEEVATTWSGLFEEEVTMPSECLPEGSSRECTRARHVQPGTFTFSAPAGLEMECPLTGACDCAADAAGGCRTYDAVISGERLTATTEVTLDESYGVWADSTPGPARDGSDPVPQPVRLVFAE